MLKFLKNHSFITKNTQIHIKKVQDGYQLAFDNLTLEINKPPFNDVIDIKSKKTNYLSTIINFIYRYCGKFFFNKNKPWLLVKHVPQCANGDLCFISLGKDYLLPLNYSQEI